MEKLQEKPAIKEPSENIKVADWTKTASILKRLETKKFYGSVEIKMESGAPVYAKVIEGFKL